MKLSSLMQRALPAVAVGLLAFMLFHLVSPDRPYVVVAAHEAPAGPALSMGSSPRNDLVLTEPGVDALHGWILERPSSGPDPLEASELDYVHRSRSRTAQILTPGWVLGSWKNAGSSPRFSLTPSTRVWTGVADGEAAAFSGRTCLTGEGLAHGQLHRVQAVDVGILSFRSEAGSLGTLAIPLVEGWERPTATGSVRVCGGGRVRFGGDCDGTETLAPSRWYTRWTPLDPAQAAMVSPRLVGSVEVSLAVAKAGASDPQFLAVTSGAAGPVWIEAPDSRHPFPLLAPSGEPAASIVLRKAGGTPEIVAHPATGEVVVHCTVRDSWFGSSDGPEDQVWSVHGRSPLAGDSLLLAGQDVRYRVESQTHANGSGGMTRWVRATPVARPDGFQFLSSLSAGRLYQPSGGWRVPECGDMGAGGPEAHALVRVRRPSEGGTRALADSTAGSTWVDRISPPGGQSSHLAWVDIKVSDALQSQGPTPEGPTSVLRICAEGDDFRVQLAADDVPAPLLPVLLQGDTPLTSREWVTVLDGARIFVGGQVLELRASVPRFEARVPPTLLALLLLVALVRSWQVLGSFRGASDTTEEANSRVLVLAVLVCLFTLMVFGCFLQARFSADPYLLASADFLQRTWFSSAVAAFTLPACLAFFRSWRWGLEYWAGRWERIREGLPAAAREMALGLMSIAVAGFVDLGLWSVGSHSEPLATLPSEGRTWALLGAVVLVGAALLATGPVLGALERGVLRILERRRPVARNAPSPASPKAKTGRSMAMDLVAHHPEKVLLLGTRRGHWLSVLLVPATLLVMAVVARLGGGAAHNNLEFGFGLGFKPAELAALLLGFTLAHILDSNWHRPGAEEERCAPVSLLALLTRQGGAGWNRWVDPRGAYLQASGWIQGSPAWFHGAGLAILVLRYGPLALGLGSMLVLRVLGVVDLPLLLGVVAVMAFVEVILRVLPQTAPILTLVVLVLLVVLLFFAVQGDFGPLLVITPALLFTTWFWGMPRHREHGPGKQWTVRGGVLAALTVAVLGATVSALVVAAHISDRQPDLARAADRLLLWREPWYAVGADWSVRARWIGAGAFGDDVVAWVANLHSDLAWIGLVECYGALVGTVVLVLYLVLVLSLAGLAQNTALRVETLSRRDDQPHARQGLRKSALFAAFVGAYLLWEVIVHLASGFAWFPPTGLTLPWVSNGGSAAVSFAILVGCAVGAVMSAHRQAHPDGGM